MSEDSPRREPETVSPRGPTAIVNRTDVRERLLALLAGFFALAWLVLTAVGSEVAHSGFQGTSNTLCRLCAAKSIASLASGSAPGASQKP